MKISTSFLPLDAVEVYTLSLDSWRMVKISWATFPAIFENNGNYLPTPLVSGALHWMALDLKGENNGVIIMSFDVNSERFRKLALLDAFMDAYLYSSKSCLALFMEKLASITSRIIEGLYFQYSIWVMREYGVVESWNKLFVIPLERIALCIAFTEYGSLLTCKTKNKKYKCAFGVSRIF